MNFDPKTLPINPIKDQYEHPICVRDAVYAHYRMLSSFGLYIKEIKIVKVENDEITLSVTSNSVMDRQNLMSETYSIDC